MPHDRFGNELKVGDEVFYRGVITSISEGSDTHAFERIAAALEKISGAPVLGLPAQE